MPPASHLAVRFALQAVLNVESLKLNENVCVNGQTWVLAVFNIIP